MAGAHDGTDPLELGGATYRLLFERNPHPMWVYDRDTLRLLAMNDAAVARYGFDRHDLLGRAVDAIGGSGRAAILPEEGPLRGTTIWPHWRKDGRPIHAEVTTHDVDLAGRPATVGLVIDVTERVEDERRRERVGRLLRAFGDLNEVLLREGERQALLDAVCRLLVERGGFLGAWVTTPGSETGRLLVAGAGTGAMDAGGDETDSPPKGEGGSRLASSISLPIPRVSGKVMSLTVRWSDGDPVGEEEGALLERLAADVAFALDLQESRVDRGEVDAALRGVEERLRSLFDGMLEGYAHCRMVFDEGAPVDWVYLDVNSAFARITGLKDVVGKTASQMMPGTVPSDRDLLERYGRVASTGEPTTFEVHVEELRTWFWVSAYSPRPGEFVAVFADTTDRKRAEEELIKLSRAVEASPASVIITDPAGRIEYVNAKFSALSGYSREEVLGKNPGLLRSGLTPDSVYRDMWETIVAGGVWRGELCNRRKDGSLFWEAITISPIRDSFGRISHFVGLKEDIDQRKRAEADLARAQEQVRQAQKMEAIGRLAGGIAHDFNNLLTVIRGYGDLLEAAMAGDPDRREGVLEIIRAADRAAMLTRQLLTFSRRQVVETRVLDLRTILDESGRMLRRLIGEDVELEMVKPPGAAFVFADVGQIEQVLMNLAVNARDAMPNGGRLSIVVAIEELSEPVTSAHDQIPPGRYVTLTVTDTGSGMDDETLSHLFEPFFTTKEKGKGTGLGLATVFGIVKQSNGGVMVESRHGIGTTFRILLPEVEASRDAPPAPGPATQAGGTETILLVEDERAVRAFTRRLLEKAGYQVIVAEGGADALARADAHPGPIHLVLTDVVMPGITGPALVREVVTRRPGVRILMMSGYSHDVLSGRGVSAEGVHFMQKPFRGAELLRRVRQAIDAPASGTRFPVIIPRSSTD